MSTFAKQRLGLTRLATPQLVPFDLGRLDLVNVFGLCGLLSLCQSVTLAVPPVSGLWIDSKGLKCDEIFALFLVFRLLVDGWHVLLVRCGTTALAVFAFL
jgi:hypothetical protein